MAVTSNLPNSLSPPVHGALDYAELRTLGLSPESIIDFSANINPYGPSPQVREAIAGVPLERYPDREAWVLREALADHHHVPVEQIIVGNGTAELIWLVGAAFVRPGDVALILGPTFGEYARAVRLMGGRVLEWRARPDDNFAFHPSEIEALLQGTHPRLCFVCRPNNPTGQICPLGALATWSERYPDTLFVVDEAYIHFTPGLDSALSPERGNILVLRSMTKDYALAGLRLGYAIGHTRVITSLRLVQPPWSVNALAQAAGVAVLHDQEHLHDTISRTLAEKERFVSELQDRNLTVVPSHTHFFLVRVGDATVFRSAFLSHGILVRDGTSFGLREYVRLSTRRPEENAVLVARLSSVLPFVSSLRKER